MKGTIKTMSILLVIMLIFAAMSTVMATSTGSAEDLITELATDTSVQTSGGIVDIAMRVMQIIRTIAVIGGVIALMVIGVKYILGSVEEKAEYKKSMMPLIIGIIVVMAATQIITMIVTALNGGS